MASKKRRKALKAKYTKHVPARMFLKDREKVVNYLKQHPYELITSTQIINNCDLEFTSSSSVSNTIKAINYYTDEHIEAFRGKGYMYYG